MSLETLNDTFENDWGRAPRETGIWHWHDKTQKENLALLILYVHELNGIYTVELIHSVFGKPIKTFGPFPTLDAAKTAYRFIENAKL